MFSWTRFYVAVKVGRGGNLILAEFENIERSDKRNETRGFNRQLFAIKVVRDMPVIVSPSRECVGTCIQPRKYMSVLIYLRRNTELQTKMDV